MNGIINLRKPKGWTSRDAVNKVRGILGERSVGHMGTLDPQGEGVLPIGVGKGTRLFDVLLKKDKVYRAEFTFGYETDTLDGDGKTVFCGGRIPSEEETVAAAATLIGKCEQVPPAYSAKNVGGARAYDLARRGVAFALKPATVEIYSIRLVLSQPPRFAFEIHCSAGTYIRSICRDLAHGLGTYATMTAITRLRAGRFSIEDSITPDELAARGKEAIISLSDALSDFPRLDIPDEEYNRLANGIMPVLTKTRGETYRVYCRGELFGLGRADENGRLKIKPYLREDHA